MKKYSADYILTSARSSDFLPAFIINGRLTADERTGNILSVEKSGSEKKKDSTLRRFKTVIAPGFINAHTHTDLTFKPEKETPRIFSGWVLSLIEKRKSLNDGERINLRRKAFKEFIESGTTSIGDIIEPAYFYDLTDILSKTNTVPRVKGFMELRGLDPFCAVQKVEEFKNFFNDNAEAFRKAEKYFSPGISPHSIYSVSENLFKEILKANDKLKLKTAIHAAEQPAEKAFISGNGGDIAENLLPALNLSKFSAPRVPFSSPISYLNYLKILDKNTSLIHANDISGEDIDIIKETGADIIHCPRSNAFFNFKKLSLKKILEKGISVSLGTDSLFSNKSLSILDEIKYAKKIHPEVKAKDLFYTATEGGAKALSFAGVTGTLEPGSYADFTIFKIGGNRILNKDNIYDAVISFKKADILSVVIGGNIVYENY
ncbi:MAG: amidohydrolase family protein [Deltaproteobacteria bacterium]|jgi:cytosine/adenosine deaminase-related metal-dependent hydrolase|nr:amidohydrolase family protein [Deltaproteobacteria bacterium]